MASQTQFDIRIETTDPSTIRSVSAVLQKLQPKELEKQRDFATILTVVSSTVTLANSLIALWKNIKSLKNAPPVKVEAESGAQLDLTAVKSQAEIEDFVKANSKR
jgi:cell division protein FtsX